MEIKVKVDKERLKELTEKYKGAKGIILNKVDDWEDYFNKKPFEEKTRDVWIEEIKEHITFINVLYEYQQREKNKIAEIFTVGGQIKKLNELRPIFYDKSGLFWIWNQTKYKWELTDDIEILNMINAATGVDIINSKIRTEIINSLKQRGRLNIPKPIKKSWIQFKDKVYDINTGESFEASPNYFVTNPIPLGVSGDTSTPKIDEIFEQWVGKEHVETLKEICAYCILPDYPLSRIFCFVGIGMNGKSKFLELLRKFVGFENVCSTELDTLITSRFEVTRLHKKLICQMGETNFNVINKTSMLKKLTGQDLIGFEYKGKNPFEDVNYAKIIIATNNLPATTDKTIGFYRRWVIMDFPNIFSEKKDILLDIPEEEFNNLATFSVISLSKLLEKREFTNEGTIEQRMERYEAKSNFLEKFLVMFTEEDLNSYITKADFYKKLIAWSKENNHREMSETTVGLEMKKMGIESDRRNFSWMNDGKGGQARVWLGIKWKE